jgi:hypothetical protein
MNENGLSAKELWHYITIVVRLWLKSIAGPAMATLALLFVIFQQIAKGSALASSVLGWSAAATLAMAVFLVFVAQLDAWRIEHRHVDEQHNLYQAEVDKHARPEIRGQVSKFRQWGTKGSGWDARGTHWHVGLACDVYLLNVRGVRTNVRSIEVDTSAIPIPGAASQINLPSPPGVLDQGIGLQFEVRMDLEFIGTPPDEPFDIKGLQIRLVDAFGGKHDLSVEPYRIRY